ncbi:MAG: RNA methyltransferase [Lapillicoccus sp.]
MTSPTEPADAVITSPANPRLKALLALRRRRTREETRSTLVEGYEELALAVAAGVTPTTAYVCPELFSPSGQAGAQDIGRQADLLAALRLSGAEVVRLSRAAFEKVAYRDGPDGLIAVLPAVGRPVQELPVGRRDLVLLAQGIEKPGNLGAMLRTADAAGVDSVVAADPATDWGNPNVVRASKGTVFALPVGQGTTQEALDWLQGNGIRLIVTTPATDVDYTDADYRGRVAIAVGAEKHGADDLLLAAADQRVRIPMAGRVNSLNVSVAAAVVLFEAVRQRDAR